MSLNHILKSWPTPIHYCLNGLDVELKFVFPQFCVSFFCKKEKFYINGIVADNFSKKSAIIIESSEQQTCRSACAFWQQSGSLIIVYLHLLSAFFKVIFILQYFSDKLMLVQTFVDFLVVH